MWQCQKCGEEILDPFENCWVCGTSREGVEDPLFEPVVDQPDLSAGLSDSPTIRGFAAGAVVSVIVDFLHPFIMLFLVYLAGTVVIRKDALRSTLLFALAWAEFAAIGGAIAGAIGARAKTVRSALVPCMLSCVLFLFIFIAALTNFLVHWPGEVLLGSLTIAAFTGALAGGFVVGRKLASQDGGNEAG